MTLNVRTLDSAIAYAIEGIDPCGPWRCLYADRSEAVFATVQLKLLIASADLTEIEPGRLRLERRSR